MNAAVASHTGDPRVNDEKPTNDITILSHGMTKQTSVSDLEFHKVALKAEQSNNLLRRLSAASSDESRNLNKLTYIDYS